MVLVGKYNFLDVRLSVYPEVKVCSYGNDLDEIRYGIPVLIYCFSLIWQVLWTIYLFTVLRLIVLYFMAQNELSLIYFGSFDIF
jgi:hypothetical protein